MPACHANCCCFSMNKTRGLGPGAVGEKTSCMAIAMAREAGPKPMEMRSRVSFAEEGEERRGREEMDMVERERMLLLNRDSGSSMELIAEGAILMLVLVSDLEIT